MWANKVYICGPYSSIDPNILEQNIKHAEDVAIKCFNKGLNCYIPHKNTAHLEKKINDYDFWLKQTQDFLDICDIMIVLNGFEKSKGSINEIFHALKTHKTIIVEDFIGDIVVNNVNNTIDISNTIIKKSENTIINKLIHTL